MRMLRSRGFTLVEMVTVILVLGVLAVGVSSFIIFGTRIFVESSAVEQVTGESRYAIERMTRDIRAALPGSARLASGNSGSESWQCLELVPIAASSSYLSIGLASGPASKTATLFRDAPQTGIAVGQFAFVYPLAESDVYANPAGNLGKRFVVQKVTEASAADTIELEFATAVRFSEASPSRRIFLTGTPISYCFIGDVSGGDIKLWHFAGYGFSPTQPDVPAMRAGGQAALMAQGVVSAAPLSLLPSTLMNNAVIQLDAAFSVNGQSFGYQHQVQVINVP
ncbi:type II secretion system GspH family protein [Shewanella sp. JM162201]|uniref:Type II secretion system GspH family protein n=1 Tax=Shewanella jiangmenensis TaxID=2837387 RepID=A0ABS5V0W2_9GAMM|nr:type II secretion system protein [Shewanella jiangmenensis]MBT1444112.1 type II secretion system GspH family protein [Shewanella jiangmenensis]